MVPKIRPVVGLMYRPAGRPRNAVQQRGVVGVRGLDGHGHHVADGVGLVAGAGDDHRPGLADVPLERIDGVCVPSVTVMVGVYGVVVEAPLPTVPEISPVLELMLRPVGSPLAEKAQRAAGAVGGADLHRNACRRSLLAWSPWSVMMIGLLDRPVEADAAGVGAVADRHRRLPRAAVAQRAGDDAGAGVDRQPAGQAGRGVGQGAAGIAGQDRAGTPTGRRCWSGRPAS